MDRKQIVTPENLTFDKLVGLYFWALGNSLALGEFDVVFQNELPNPRQLPDGVEDIDVRIPYNRNKNDDGSQRYGSGAEREAEKFGLLSMSGVQTLLAMLARNNKDGYLKSEPKSLVGLIRALPEVAHNVSAHEHKMYIISLFWPVLDEWFTVWRHHATEAGLITTPLTMPGYQEMLRITGRNADESTVAIERAFEKSKVRKAQSQGRANTAKATEFVINGHQSLATFIGHLVETDDRKMASEYLRLRTEVMALIVRNSSGNYAMFVRGVQNLSALHQALEKIEPGKWHYDTRPMESGQPPYFLNGSASRPAQASSLKPQEFIAMVQKHHHHKTRAQQYQGR